MKSSRHFSWWRRGAATTALALHSAMALSSLPSDVLLLIAPLLDGIDLIHLTISAKPSPSSSSLSLVNVKHVDEYETS